MTSKKTDGLLARVDFPLYSIQMLTDRHVLVGGGGGSAKTGVLNGFEIFELSIDGSGRYSAREAVRHETGPKVVMNSAVFSNKKHTYLVAGQESHSQLYSIQISVQQTNEETANGEAVTDSGLRNRRPNKPHQNGFSESPRSSGLTNKSLIFKFIAGDSIQTDFSSTEPCQRVVTLSRCGGWMATGGTDGQIRLWGFPSLRLVRLLKGHSKELDDLHFSPDSKQLVSVGKDGLGLIWDVKSGRQLHSLSWSPPQVSPSSATSSSTPSTLKYLFKRSRFGGIVGSSGHRLFTISNPGGGRGRGTGKEKTAASSWLQCWSEEGKLAKAVSSSQPLSALAVRDDGVFLAVGTMFSGSVSIYIAFSLQRVHHVEGVHSMFVTGLELLPSTCSWNTAEVAVLSISVDNRVCINSLSYRRTLPPWIVVLLIIVTIFLTFLICSHFGL